MLDASVFHMPPLKRDFAQSLMASAHQHVAALVPASPNDRAAALGNLRLRTIPRNEGDDEAKARFRNLVNDLADVPADILTDACDAYVNHVDEKGRPNRFFPGSPAELRVFTDPLLRQRRMRAYRLEQMANEAATAAPTDVCTPEEAAQIKREMGLA